MQCVFLKAQNKTRLFFLKEDEFGFWGKVELCNFGADVY